MWVVQWAEAGKRYHAVRWSWDDAMAWAQRVASTWGGPVRVVSETTHLYEQRSRELERLNAMVEANPFSFIVPPKGLDGGAP